MFSEQQRIVESAAWLNLKPENGLDGGHAGPHSAESRAKMSAAHKGKPRKPCSEETRAKMSESHKGKKRGPYKKKLNTSQLKL